MNCVEVCDKGSKGRGVSGTRNFTQDEIIFEEVPLVSCQFAWNKKLGYKACDHCMRPLENAEENVRRLAQQPDLRLPYIELLPTPESPTFCECKVTYCSVECQELAATLYHSSLCSSPSSDKFKTLLKLQETWMNFHYPPESSSIMIVLKIYATLHQAQDKSAVIQQFTDFVSDASNTAVLDKFLGRFKENINKLREEVIQCVQVLSLEVPESLLSPESFLKVLSIMALNSQGIGTSPFSEWVDKVENKDESVQALVSTLYSTLEETVGLDFLNNEGSGLYKLQSKINHSCDPNAEIIFPYGNHVLGIRTLRDVPAGDEITISYIDTCQLSRSRHSRNKVLKENYLFTCLCARCEAEASEPDETSSDEDDDSFSDDDDVQMS